MNGEEKAVLIQGKLDINRAVDGDQVVIEIYPKQAWKAESELLVQNDHDDDVPPEGPSGTLAGNDNLAGKPGSTGNSSENTGERQISGRVVAIAKRNWKPYCGSIEPLTGAFAGGYCLFDPVNRRIPRIRIKTSQYEKLVNKRIVVVINDWPATSNYPIGHYTQWACRGRLTCRTLGEIGDREVETQVLLLEHEIPPNVFSKEVLDCLPPSDWHITEDNARGREVGAPPIFES